MSELKFILLMRVLSENFNTIDLVKFLEKNQKIYILIIAITLKVTSCRTIHEQKKKVKKSEKPIFYGQNKLLF
jgi:hypothetical protein